MPWPRHGREVAKWAMTGGNVPGVLAGFRAGSHEALTVVYRSHLDEIAELVRRGFQLDRTSGASVRGLTSPAEQCDLIQETFARAFSSAARQAYDGLSPYRWYLLRITNQQAQARDFASGLEGQLREVYQLRFQDGLGQREVASRLGATRRRVRTQEEALLKGLRKSLKRAGLWP